MLTMKTARETGWPVYGEYDLCVVGAGFTGLGAAIAGARQGLKTLLIESYGFAGGVATKSCVPLFFNFLLDGKQSTANLTEEFVRRLDEIGAASLMLNNDCAMPEYAPIAGRPLLSKVQMQPEAIKLMARRMLAEAGVECLFYAHFADAVVENGHVEAAAVSCIEGMRLVKAKTFIDCTGDGLLCQAAGAPMRVYGQDTCMHKSMFYYVGGVTPFNHDYNCALYKKCYAEGLQPDNVREHFGYSMQLNPGVCQIAMVYGVGDALSSADMTRMDGEMREQVFELTAFLQKHMPGFQRCYLLDTSVHVGVRASQGIAGVETLTQDLLLCGEFTSEPVALTSRSFGGHNNGKKFWSPNRSTGGMSAVPMKAMLSPALDNVIAAGRCISAEPEIIGAFRMMNTCMTMGEAAGLMAAIAVGKGCGVHGVRYDELRPMMDRANFILPDQDGTVKG